MHLSVFAVEVVPHRPYPSVISLTDAVVSPERPGNEIGRLKEAAGPGVRKKGHIGHVGESSNSTGELSPLVGPVLHLLLSATPIVNDNAPLVLPNGLASAPEHLVELVENLLPSTLFVIWKRALYYCAEKRAGIGMIDAVVAPKGAVAGSEDTPPSRPGNPLPDAVLGTIWVLDLRRMKLEITGVASSGEVA